MSQSPLFQLITLLAAPAFLLCLGGVAWWLWRHQRETGRRTARSFRGNCGRCGYEPETGTRVCPECGGPVLDTRLFRPLNTDCPENR